MRLKQLPSLPWILVLLALPLLAGCSASILGATRSAAAPDRVQFAQAQAEARVLRATNAATRSTIPSAAALREMRTAMLDAADSGRWHDAHAQARRLRLLEPGSPHALAVIARAHYWGFLDDEAALEAARTCLRIERAPVECREVYAMIHYDRASFREALASLDQVIELEPVHRRAHELRIRALMQLGENEEAVRNLRLALEIWPSDMQLRILFASALERSDALRAAELAWHHVATHHTSPTQGLRYLQAFHERIGNREAVRQLQRELANLEAAPTRRRLDPL